MNDKLKTWAWIIAGVLALTIPICLQIVLKQNQTTKFAERLLRTEVTSLDQLNAVAGTGRTIHVEANALGDPAMESTNGVQIALQKLSISRAGTSRSSSGDTRFYPKYFLVGDGRGVLWIASEDYVRAASFNDKESQRDFVAKQWLSDYDRYINKGCAVVVATVHKGAHISALGEVVKYDNPPHYVLHAPSHAVSGECLLIAQ